jgi:hypothetical protein
MHAGIDYGWYFINCRFVPIVNKSAMISIVTSFKRIPLNNVRIAAEKSGEVIFTDSIGRFSINCSDKDLLRVFASGFDGKKTKIGKESFYKIDLSFNDNVDNFNDAVSHGHISADLLKNAISEEALKNARDYSKYKSIYELISSEIYSVSVDGTTILNKKVKSFDGTPEVLLVVDDKVVRDISYINPDYVKSVEFIEDVGATMYGSMGANGVLKITLK